MSDFDLAAWCEHREPSRQFASYHDNGVSAINFGSFEKPRWSFVDHRLAELSNAIAREVVQCL